MIKTQKRKKNRMEDSVFVIKRLQSIPSKELLCPPYIQKREGKLQRKKKRQIKPKRKKKN